MQDWKIGNRRVVLHTHIWDVIETEKQMPNGKTGSFTSLEAPNWCTAIIRNTDTGRFVMVREFRHGIDDWIHEFPSGTVEPGEAPEDAVLREVEEETGYKNGKIIRKLFTGNPNPAFMHNTMNGYYIEVTGTPEQQHLDTSEFIQVLEVEDPEQYLSERSSVANQLLWARFLLFRGSAPDPA